MWPSSWRDRQLDPRRTMVNRTDFDAERLPAASMATKRAWYLPSFNLRLPTQPLNRLLLRPAAPCSTRRPTRRRRMQAGRVRFARVRPRHLPATLRPVDRRLRVMVTVAASESL